MISLAIVLLFSFIILIHEFGHYLAARLTGVKVLSFNFGFGPALYTKKKNGTLFALRLLPLGGSVQLAGLDEIAHRTIADKQNFTSKSWLQRFFILSAGALLNILCALLIFILIYALVGVPIGADTYKQISWLKAIQIGFWQTIYLIKIFITSLFGLFRSASLDQLSGPIGIISLSTQVAAKGWVVLLYFTGLLSLNIGFLNLLPFPALDGGRLLFLFIELVLRRKPNETLEKYVHAAGFMILLALIIWVSIIDIQKLITK